MRAEQQIHRAVVDHLRQRAAPKVVWFHVPNGGRRGRVEAAIFKGLGVRPGVADLILLHHGHAYALELKAEGGKPTEAQMQFISDWNHAGGSGCIVIGLDAALNQLETWGILRGETWQSIGSAAQRVMSRIAREKRSVA